MDEKILAPTGFDLSLDPAIKKDLVNWEDFTSYYLQLEDVSQAFSWAKADVLLALSEKFGEKSLDQFAKDIGQSPTTVVSYVRVARAFPSAKRVPGVSFTSHFQASFADSYDTKSQKFDGEERFKWVETAADEQLSVGELKAKMHREKEKISQGVEILPCSRCGTTDGTIKQYVIFSPGDRKRSVTLELHENCYENVVRYAQGNE